MVTNRQTVQHVRGALVELVGDDTAREFAEWFVRRCSARVWV